MDATDFDVIVAGSGISGMAAGIAAQEAGARVVMIERDAVIGGSARWAYGFDIEGATFDEMRADNPQGDPVLQRLLVDQFHDALAWLQACGVSLEEGEPGRFNYVPCQGEGGLLAFTALRERFAALGGTLLTSTALKELRSEGDRRVIGAVVENADGSTSELRGAVILATGGFGADDAMKRRYLGPDGDRTGFYGSHFHMGDGIAAATAHGAGVTAGVTLPAGACVYPPPFDPPAGMFQLGATGGPSTEVVPPTIQALLIRPPVGAPGSILLNLDGQRFVDEALPYSFVALQVTRQRKATAYCLFGRTVYAEHAAGLSLARQHGAMIHQAPSIAELIDLLEKPGGNDEPLIGAVARRTLSGYEAAAFGDGPVYAIRVVQAVNDTAGGVTIDGSGRVLDIHGEVLPGLFAVGADGGRPYDYEHGGLAYGLIMGRQAGQAAADHARQVSATLAG